MSFSDLREFMAFLEKKGQLKRITAPVDCELEITEIADRVGKAGGPALLFENVVSHNTPVLTNIFFSPERTAWALGVDRLEELGQRVEKLLEMDVPASLWGKFGKLMDLSELARFGPKVVKSGLCQEVVEINPSLTSLPVLKCWPDDGGRFITLPLVITKNPATGKRNVGMYRLQVFDDTTTGMHWHLHKNGADHLRQMATRGERLEVAVALGGSPALIYTATAPLPPDVDEVFFAGWLQRAKIELVKCKTVDLEAPAGAEIVLEGYVDPAEWRREGPFGDHTGYYSLAEDYPVFHVTCLTRRRDPIYPATIVGRPPMEDYYLGKATERLFLPLIKMVIPEMVDISMPAEGVFHNLVVVSIKKTYPGQARKVMHALWGMGQMMLAKIIVVVDEDVNVQDLSEVIWRATNNLDPRRDLVFADGPLDALDHSSPQAHYGSKLGIDATAKGEGEGHPRPWPEVISMPEEIKQLVNKRWSSYGL